MNACISGESSKQLISSERCYDSLNVQIYCFLKYCIAKSADMAGFPWPGYSIISVAYN